MNEKITINNSRDFKPAALNAAILNLKKKLALSKEDEKELLNLYMKDQRDIKILFDEISNLNEEILNKKLNKIMIEKTSKKENKISLEYIDEFRNKENTKDLIKIHYPYPSEKIKVIENHSGKSAKEIFEESKDEDGLVTVDGFVNTTDVSKRYVEPDRIEVKMRNVTELATKGEFNKLSTKEKECVLGLVACIIKQLAKNEEHEKALKKIPVEQLIMMLNKNVFIAPDENIVVLCIPDDPTKDEIKAVTKNSNNEYELEDLKLGGKEMVKDEEVSTPDNSNNDIDAKELSVEEKEKENGIPFVKKPNWKNNRAA